MRRDTTLTRIALAYTGVRTVPSSVWQVATSKDGYEGTPWALSADAPAPLITGLSSYRPDLRNFNVHERFPDDS